MGKGVINYIRENSNNIMYWMKKIEYLVFFVYSIIRTKHYKKDLKSKQRTNYGGL